MSNFLIWMLVRLTFPLFIPVILLSVYVLLLIGINDLMLPRAMMKLLSANDTNNFNNEFNSCISSVKYEADVASFQGNQLGYTLCNAGNSTIGVTNPFASNSTIPASINECVQNLVTSTSNEIDSHLLPFRLSPIMVGVLVLAIVYFAALIAVGLGKLADKFFQQEKNYYKKLDRAKRLLLQGVFSPSNDLEQGNNLESLPVVLCPLSKKLLNVDVVITPDGNSFNKAAIEKYINDHGVDPITKRVTSQAELKPNKALEQLVEGMVQQYNFAAC